MIKSIHDFGEKLKKEKLLYAGAEVGVAEGRSSLQFLKWGFKKWYLVDMWQHVPGVTGDINSPQSWHDQNLKDAKGRMKPFGKKAVFLKGDSVVMANKVKDDSLGFVYLDGNHQHAPVLADLKAWLPKLKTGGIIAGHDYNHMYGVKTAVDEFTGGKAHTLPEQAIENQGFWFYADDVR